jgi:DNA-binding MarR family transcriptional regulator
VLVVMTLLPLASVVKWLDDIMSEDSSSSHFTELGQEGPVGPPMIGALLRAPWEAVQRRMLERLHEHGFDDLDAAHLQVFQYPGPQGTRPSQLATRLRMSKQALNYLLGQLERLGYLGRRADPHDLRSKRVVLTARGEAAIHVIRTAVGEIESEWSHRIGARRFDQLRSLLLQINQGAGRGGRPSEG